MCFGVQCKSAPVLRWVCPYDAEHDTAPHRFSPHLLNCGKKADVRNRVPCPTTHHPPPTHHHRRPHTTHRRSWCTVRSTPITCWRRSISSNTSRGAWFLSRGSRPRWADRPFSCAPCPAPRSSVAPVGLVPHNTQRATRNAQRATRNAQRATRNAQHATRDLTRRTADLSLEQRYCHQCFLVHPQQFSGGKRPPRPSNAGRAGLSGRNWCVLVSASEAGPEPAATRPICRLFLLIVCGCMRAVCACAAREQAEDSEADGGHSRVPRSAKAGGLTATTGWAATRARAVSRVW
jgi:hypothetical protein